MVTNQLDTLLFKKAASEGQRYTYLELENIVVLRLVEHLTLPVQHRQSLAIMRTNPHREVAKPGSNPGFEQGPDRLERVRSQRGQEHRGRGVERSDAPAQCLLFRVGQPIYLVEDQDLRAAPQIEVAENVFHHAPLLFPARA